MGALTDAQAVQKFVQRSIKVNGKPLSGDVNLLAADVNAWNKTEADGRFVKRTGDTMAGTLIIDGATVLPTQPLRAATDVPALWKQGISLSTLEFDDKNTSSYPAQPYATLVNLSVTEHRGIQLLSEKATNNFWLRSADAKKYSDFVKLYHTQNKPTAADVGALTDTQAAQKYALRSYKVNGKPLSGDVNLLAGDVNAWNKSEADGRYLMKSGGQLVGTVKTTAEIQSTSIDNYRIVGGDYGTFWRNDGNSMYLMLTKAKDQYGTFNDFRPFAVDVKNGNVSFGHNVGITGDLKTFRSFRADKGASIGEDLWVDRNATIAGLLKVGNSTHASDGNIMGTRWGGKWLWDAVIEQDNGRVDWGSFNREVGARATVDWVNQNFIQNVRYSAETQHGATGIYTYHENTVLTGFNNWDGDYSPEELFWSYIQIYKNGQWITIGR
ncbi:TPA: hypothetical protein ACXI1T_003690 [Serratia liquefaciens]